MQTRIQPGSATYRFASLHELGTYVRDAKRTWRSDYSVSEARGATWDLSAGYDGAVSMAREGWLEGAARSQEALKVFAPTSPEPDTVTDFYGYRPHVARFCAGAPDSMIRKAYTADTGMGKVLTLIVPVNALAHVDAKYMANFGVAVAQYVAQLEAQGTRVELLGCIVSNVSGQRCAHSWTVKNADQPLDLAVVAFSIGHPAMFRRLGFALRERCAIREDPSYGRTTPAQLSDIINAPDGAVILNGMANADAYAQTPQAGLAYVSEQIDAALAAQFEEAR